LGWGAGGWAAQAAVGLEPVEDLGVQEVEG